MQLSTSFVLPASFLVSTAYQGTCPGAYNGVYNISPLAHTYLQTCSHYAIMAYRKTRLASDNCLYKLLTGRSFPTRVSPALCVCLLWSGHATVSQVSLLKGHSLGPFSLRCTVG